MHDFDPSVIRYHNEYLPRLEEEGVPDYFRGTLDTNKNGMPHWTFCAFWMNGNDVRKVTMICQWVYHQITERENTELWKTLSDLPPYQKEVFWTLLCDAGDYGNPWDLLEMTLLVAP